MKFDQTIGFVTKRLVFEKFKKTCFWCLQSDDWNQPPFSATGRLTWCVVILATVKVLNFRMPENFAVIYLKFKHRGQTF